MSLPRGIRSCNPGNLKELPGDKTRWVGERATDDDPIFEEFTEMKYGIRALMKLLIGYIDRGYSTIEKIITRYAPSNENDTKAYIDSVCQRTGYAKDDVLSISEYTIKSLVYAISRHENGGEYLDKDDVNEAWTLI